MTFNKKYDKEAETMMKNFYRSLSEKDKRRYAAVEIKKLGYGGQSYICGLFHCNHKNIERAVEELEDKELLKESQVRQPGGGRKLILSQDEEIEDIFWEVMINYTAGDPMNDEIKWTSLSVSDVVFYMKERGKEISEYTALQLLEKHGYKKRAARKDEEAAVAEDRDEQFKKISVLKQEYMNAGNPVISVDVKKKNKQVTFIETGNSLRKKK
jgi:hypothetical protein